LAAVALVCTIGGFGSSECSVHMDDDESFSSSSSAAAAIVADADAETMPLMRHLFCIGLGSAPPPAFKKHNEFGQEACPGALHPGTLITHATQRSFGAP